MSDQKSQKELDAIEMRFAEEWYRGGKPTLADYVARHPHYAEELTDFVFLFAISETATPDTLETEAPSSTASTLASRVLAADRSTAETLSQRLTELASTPSELAKELDLPSHIIDELQARRITCLPSRLLVALARKFCQTIEQIEDLIAYRPPTANPAFQLRSAGLGKAHGPQAQTFREAMLLCLEEGLATKEQAQKWLDGGEG